MPLTPRYGHTPHSLPKFTAKRCYMYPSEMLQLSVHHAAPENRMRQSLFQSVRWSVAHLSVLVGVVVWRRRAC
jgi:hypothetical protein